MPLNIDRIRQLAADDAEDVPPLTDEQAEAAVRLLSSSKPTAAKRRAG